jgi:hypothetical protein
MIPLRGMENKQPSTRNNQWLIFNRVKGRG